MALKEVLINRIILNCIINYLSLKDLSKKYSNEIKGLYEEIQTNEKKEIIMKCSVNPNKYPNLLKIYFNFIESI